MVIALVLFLCHSFDIHVLIFCKSFQVVLTVESKYFDHHEKHNEVFSNKKKLVRHFKVHYWFNILAHGHLGDKNSSLYDSTESYCCHSESMR